MDFWRDYFDYSRNKSVLSLYSALSFSPWLVRKVITGNFTRVVKIPDFHAPLRCVNGNLHVPAFLLDARHQEREMAAAPPGETSKTEESSLVKGSSALGWSRGEEREEEAEGEND